MKNCKEMIRVALLLLTLVSSSSCLAENLPVTLHQDPKNPTYYYGTWYNGNYSYEAPKGTEVWYATATEVDNGVIRLEKSEDNIIYSGCGVILRSKSQSNESNGSTIEVTLTDKGTIVHTKKSALTGTGGQPIQLKHNEYDYYVLNATQKYGVGFYKISSDYIGAFKAYFEVPKSSTNAARSMLLFDFDDSPTGIDDV